jgi:DNA-binding response OmpR family regulator
MDKRALIVDPDPIFVSQLIDRATAAGFEGRGETDFQKARAALTTYAPNFLIANVKLGMYNGIHLAYAARVIDRTICSLLYTDETDAAVAREAQLAGAFYEPRAFVPHSLGRYLTARLPAADRRSVARLDRRRSFRGGRRATDIETLRL